MIERLQFCAQASLSFLLLPVVSRAISISIFSFNVTFRMRNVTWLWYVKPMIKDKTFMPTDALYASHLSFYLLFLIRCYTSSAFSWHSASAFASAFAFALAAASGPYLSTFLYHPVSSLACYAYNDADVSCSCSCYNMMMVVLWALSRTIWYDSYFRPVYCVLFYLTLLYFWSDSCLLFLFNLDFDLFIDSSLDNIFHSEAVNSYLSSIFHGLSRSFLHRW